jgi:VanZ family protein
VTRPGATRPVAGTLLYATLLIVLLVMPTGLRHQRRGYLQEYDLRLTRRLVTDVVLNFALFVPLGWGLARTARARGLRPAAVVVAGGATTLVFSLAMETVQWFLPLRYSSIVDVAANGAGGLAGAWWAGRG